MREGSISLGALQRALAEATEAGAASHLLDLRERGLSTDEPAHPLEAYGENGERFVAVDGHSSVGKHATSATTDNNTWRFPIVAREALSWPCTASGA